MAISKIPKENATSIFTSAIISDTDFTQALSNAIKSVLDPTNNSTPYMVTVSGFAYGTLTNLPSGFSGNFRFIALLSKNGSAGISVCDMDNGKFGTVRYNPS